MTPQSYTLMNLVNDMHGAYLAWYGDEDQALLATTITFVGLFGNPAEVEVVDGGERIAMRTHYAA